MKVGVFYSESNAQSVRSARKLKRILTENKIDFVDLEEGAENSATVKMDLIVVFGGDGSVLKAVQIALDKTPLVAINTGNVGFLTSFERDELDVLVKAIKNKALNFTKRKLLAVSVGESVYYALNDAVIMKNYQNHLQSGCVRLELKVDDAFVDKYVADGLIFSTPTGSTAYALSAGGPIVTPDISAVVAAPICAHSLHSRPIVLSPKSLAKTTVLDSSEECALYVDGVFKAAVSSGGTVGVQLSEKAVKICESGENFFDKLNKKIVSWSAINEGENHE